MYSTELLLHNPLQCKVKNCYSLTLYHVYYRTVTSYLFTMIVQYYYFLPLYHVYSTELLSLPLYHV